MWDLSHQQLQLVWPQDRTVGLGYVGWKQLLEGSRLREQDG